VALISICLFGDKIKRKPGQNIDKLAQRFFLNKYDSSTFQSHLSEFNIHSKFTKEQAERVEELFNESQALTNPASKKYEIYGF